MTSDIKPFKEYMHDMMEVRRAQGKNSIFGSIGDVWYYLKTYFKIHWVLLILLIVTIVIVFGIVTGK